ncbi:hypothetical protein GF337_04190 [candidate division KSB1 bacterium]|nr:hypothetical protein [candidate division KSB1 bacterium]
MKSNSSINSYQTQNLKFSTTYFWKIVSHDNHGNMTSGDIWSFTTRPENILPPFMPNSPKPQNGKTGINISGVKLQWHSGDPNGIDTVEYDIYFDTVNPPTNLISEAQTDTFYNLPLLDFDTQYYWKVHVRNSFDMTTEGDIWNFTTRTSTMFFEEHFDDYMTGFPPPDSAWTYFGDFETVKVTDQIFQGTTGKSCQLIDTIMAYSNGITREISQEKSTGVFEFAWRVDRSDDFLGMRLYPSTVDSLHRGPQISIRGDSLEYYDRDFTWKFIADIDSATWYKMRIVYDCQLESYSIYVNDVLLVHDAGWTGIDISSFKYIYFLTFSNRRCSSGYIDEVRYYASELLLQ